MTTFHEVSLINQGYTCKIPDGGLLSDLIKGENLPFGFPCNGRGMCGKCRVKVSGPVSDPTPAELKRLNREELSSGVRLACQVRLLGPVIVEILGAADSLNILIEGFPEVIPADPISGHPSARRIIIPAAATLNWENLNNYIPSQVAPSLHILQKLPLVSKDAGELSLALIENQVVALKPSADMKTIYGVGVDVGTTTLAAYLVDALEGQIMQTAVAVNPQGSYGADVISRIGLTGEPEGLERLHQLIIGAVNELIRELAQKAGINSEEILELNLVGNTCMTHLLLKVNPAQLGKLPFEPVFKGLVKMAATDLGFSINPNGLVHVLPGIGGFIGSDITVGVWACKLSPDKPELFIDIGTNGEVVVTGKGKMVAGSTAAGPAFEGAGIACGMTAKPGAISGVQFQDGRLMVTTIDNVAPRGICGTGLIRLIVELKRKGIITDSGRFTEEAVTDPNLDREQKRYYLARNGSTAVYLSDHDLRQIQLAKAAFRAGWTLLLGRVGLEPGELETVYLAGAFGTFLRAEDAVFLGLIPPVPLERIKPVGNTAGIGTVLSMLSKDALSELGSLSARIEPVELAGDPRFMDVFTEGLLFEL
ncbi:MAG TPA: ASKHA domain-containing protein [Bacillota bacterium]|nr:ASKHA domain-containing protein [Bacillota bacterium]